MSKVNGSFSAVNFFSQTDYQPTQNQSETNPKTQTDNEAIKRLSQNLQENKANYVSKTNSPKLPPIPERVSFTAIGVNTEKKMAMAGFMAIAAKSGIAEESAQLRFADKMVEKYGSNILRGDEEFDDKKVNKEINGKKATFELSKSQMKDLVDFRQEYIRKGGRIAFNASPTVNLRTINTEGISNVNPLDNSPKTRFSVYLSDNGKPIDSKRLIAQYAEDKYRSGNLWGDDYGNIAQMSVNQGAKANPVSQEKVGNKIKVTFELSPNDQLKIDENYKIVQAQANEIDAFREKYNQENPLNQFILGVFDGAWDSVKGNAEAIAHPLETLGAIKDAVVAIASSLNQEDLAKIYEYAKTSGKELFTTKEGINSLPHKAGYAVGMIVTEAITAKGIGAVLEGLKGLKGVETLLSKLNEFKNLAKAKVAAKFSDEAAALARQRVSQALRNPTFYSGFAGGDMIKDLTIFAGNKLKNGAIPFKEFVELSVKEYGSNIKGKIDELTVAYKQSMRDLGFGNDIIELDIEKTSKIAKFQFQRETALAKQKLFDGIQEAENKGELLKLSKENSDWLKKDVRRKELAFDPDTKEFKIEEAKAIIEAEKQGVIEKPVRRGIFDDGKSRGTDYIDANGIEWDVKKAEGGATSIVKALEEGENVIVDARGLSEAEFKSLKTDIEKKRPKNGNEIRYVR